MGLRYRKLLFDSSVYCSEYCETADDGNACNKKCVAAFTNPNFAECISSCVLKTPDDCGYCFEYMDAPTSSQHHRLGKIALAMIFIRPRRRRSTQHEDEEEEERIETHGQFVDQDQGPVVDHPIWYIRTVGLQPSEISSITVCKYKRGDGLVEGTECSVCLSEFQDDETLRLLPKCSHAFHIPCIDTWLRSHTNCPLCRAPIVTNTAIATSSQANLENTSGGEETRIEVLEDDQESDREMEGREGGVRVVTEEESGLQSETLNEEEDGIQPLRRSVSLDSLSAFKIIQALANVHPAVESDGNSGSRRAGRGNGSAREIVQSRGGGNQNLIKFMATSSFARSFQIGPSSFKRSLSCSGKFFLSRPCRNRNSGVPS
ncbi:unnamed protein product [Dovyalis caffra]|uniref:RING-type E3 ubiquitin transferase n=1 Tax=Dovyalis caffra TaxID=77055 RepID=A0AAV1SRJ5_9ROSI|nr:unnamed protein product [Dovyalis caffra]